jgi:hypothetical protein
VLLATSTNDVLHKELIYDEFGEIGEILTRRGKEK